MHTVKTALIGYAATLCAFVVLDAIWLQFVAIEMFRQNVGAILRDQPDVGAAVAFYAIYAAGLYGLAVRPALAVQQRQAALANGALVGLTAYATFDLTNLAIIAGWTPKLAVLDIGWGTVASAIAALAGYAVASHWSPRAHADGSRRQQV